MDVRERAKAIEDQIIAWRREIHQNPELGLDTVKTEALVAGALRDMGIEVRTGSRRTRSSGAPAR
jgi:metal-dependent amidase/aminoacylase/carboxypeptidase family protein